MEDSRESAIEEGPVEFVPFPRRFVEFVEEEASVVIKTPWKVLGPSESDLEDMISMVSASSSESGISVLRALLVLRLDIVFGVDRDGLGVATLGADKMVSLA